MLRNGHAVSGLRKTIHDEAMHCFSTSLVSAFMGQLNSGVDSELLQQNILDTYMRLLLRFRNL